MILSRRRLFYGLLGAVPAVALLAGCGRGGAARVGLADVAMLASDALLTALLGGPPDRTDPLMGKAEPPLLEPGVFENVLLATDYAGFVKASNGALSEGDLKAIEADVVKQTGKFLEKRRFTIKGTPFPPSVDPAADKVLVATFTPATEEGGSPEEKQQGKAKTYVMIRLSISDPKTNKVLRIREFYSGRDALLKK